MNERERRFVAACVRHIADGIIDSVSTEASNRIFFNYDDIDDYIVIKRGENPPDDEEYTNFAGETTGISLAYDAVNAASGLVAEIDLSWLENDKNAHAVLLRIGHCAGMRFSGAGLEEIRERLENNGLRDGCADSIMSAIETIPAQDIQWNSEDMRFYLTRTEQPKPVMEAN